MNCNSSVNTLPVVTYVIEWVSTDGEYHWGSQSIRMNTLNIMRKRNIGLGASIAALISLIAILGIAYSLLPKVDHLAPNTDSPSQVAAAPQSVDDGSEIGVALGPPMVGPLPGPVPVPPRQDTDFYVFRCAHLNEMVVGTQSFGTQNKVGVESKIQQVYPQYIETLKRIGAKNADRDTFLQQNGITLHSPDFYWSVDVYRLVNENGSMYAYLDTARGTDNPTLVKAKQFIDGMVFEKWKLDPNVEPTLVIRSFDFTPLWNELQIIR